MLVSRPFVLIQAGSLVTTDETILEGRIASQWSLIFDIFSRFIPTIGDVIEFEPEKVNTLLSMIGRDEEVHEVDNEVMTYTSISITPRWELV